MNNSLIVSIVGLSLCGTTAGCFSKPGFTGGETSKDASGDGVIDATLPDAPYVEPACTDGRNRLPDSIKLRTDQISIDDLDRDLLDDIALVGEDDAGGQHVFIYFGQSARDIDLNCWDHQIQASGFSKIGGVKIEPGWYAGDDSVKKGTLFVYGHDAAEQAKLRLEEFVVDGDQTFAGPNFRKGPTIGQLWLNEAEPHSAFLVWRYAGAVYEVFFGGDNQFFTIPIPKSGLGTEISAVANSDDVKIVQAMDVSSTELVIDDGRNLFNIERTAPTDTLTLPSSDRLSPPDTGAVDGAVFATQEWTYRYINDTGISLGVRVPRVTTATPTSLQLIARNEVFNKALEGVSPVADIGPFITGATLARNVGALGNTLAAVVTTFTTAGQPAVNRLAVQANATLAGNIMPTQNIRLRNGSLPVVFAGNFRSSSKNNIVVLYPRRKLSEERTRSVCYEALSRAGMDCLRECGANVCAF